MAARSGEVWLTVNKHDGVQVDAGAPRRRELEERRHAGDVHGADPVKEHVGDFDHDAGGALSFGQAAVDGRVRHHLPQRLGPDPW